MRFGMWSVRRLYRAGIFTAAAKELAGGEYLGLRRRK
jgi:hypothetical protein